MNGKLVFVDLEIHQRLAAVAKLERRSIVKQLSHILDTALPPLPKTEPQPQESRGLLRDIRMSGLGSNR